MPIVISEDIQNKNDKSGMFSSYIRSDTINTEYFMSYVLFSVLSVFSVFSVCSVFSVIQK